MSVDPITSNTYGAASNIGTAVFDSKLMAKVIDKAIKGKVNQALSYALGLINLLIVLLESGTQLAVAIVDKHFKNNEDSLAEVSIAFSSFNMFIALFILYPPLVFCGYFDKKNTLFLWVFFSNLISVACGIIFVGIDAHTFSVGSCNNLSSELCLKGNECPSFMYSNLSVDTVFESFDCGLRIWNLTTSCFMLFFVILNLIAMVVMSCKISEICNVDVDN